MIEGAAGVSAWPIFSYDEVAMASEVTGTFSVACPCCKAELVIDPSTRPVLHSASALAPPPITDLAAEVNRLRTAGAEREQAFQRSLQA